jgi:DNA helicase-2/ATP-dependent DNA helicase PcrA
MRSRFFDELPEAALKWITPRNQGFGAPQTVAPWHNRPEPGFTTRQVEVVPERKLSLHGLRNGTQVFHAKFGEGTVLTLEGTGEEARAQINFPRHGVKWLALSVAKLTPVP